MPFSSDKFNQISSGKNTEASVAYSYLADEEGILTNVLGLGFFDDKAPALQVNDRIEAVGVTGASLARTRFETRIISNTDGSVQVSLGHIPVVIDQYFENKFMADPGVRTDGIFPVTAIGLAGYKVLGVQYYFTGTVGGTDLELTIGINSGSTKVLTIPDPAETRIVDAFAPGFFPDVEPGDYLSVQKHAVAHVGIFTFHMVWMLEPIRSSGP